MGLDLPHTHYWLKRINVLENCIAKLSISVFIVLTCYCLVIRIAQSVWRYIFWTVIVNLLVWIANQLQNGFGW